MFRITFVTFRSKSLIDINSLFVSIIIAPSSQCTSRIC